MAMLPFCGYNMADYFSHWIAMGRKVSNRPKIFHVNWFRKDNDGKFLWPGFGDNLRVLEWILARCRGEGKAEETPIGWVPSETGIDLEGLNLREGTMKKLLNVDSADWTEEVAGQKTFFEKFGNDLSPEMWKQLEGLEKRLNKKTVAG